MNYVCQTDFIQNATQYIMVLGEIEVKFKKSI